MGQTESAYSKLGARRARRRVRIEDVNEKEELNKQDKEDRRAKKQDGITKPNLLFPSISWKRGVDFSDSFSDRQPPAWFHGWCRRSEVEQRLVGGPEGQFLVKNSTEFPGDLTLCLCCEEKVFYYRIRREESSVTIDSKELFKDVSNAKNYVVS